MSNEEDSEMVFRAKMHFFCKWSLDFGRSSRKVTSSSSSTSGKGQFILEFNKSNDNDREHNALTFSKEYFPNEID